MHVRDINVCKCPNIGRNLLSQIFQSLQGVRDCRDLEKFPMLKAYETVLLVHEKIGGDEQDGRA